jgi:serine/threonine protein kinase
MTCSAPVAALAPAAPLPQFNGPPSSLAQAGINGGVTIGPGDSSEPSPANTDKRRSVREILARGGGERYQVVSEIARGGMGAVLRAVDCDIRREVAVKYLLDQADPRKKARFIEEAQVTGQLEHPSIVPIHELGVDARQRLFFSMKMVRGRSLQHVLSELRDQPRAAEKDYPLGRLLTIFVNVCHALAYAHSRGVVHRDLKPANIMIGDFGEVYVMDWGLAKVLQGNIVADKPSAVIQSAPSFDWAETGGDGPSSATVKSSRQAAADQTVDGMILGTPLYMPPEQAKGDVARIDRRSDIYALGAILYEMLTLQPPVDKQGGHLAILMRVSQGEIVPPEQRAPPRARAGKIPRELAAVAMKALAFKPEDRYQTAESLRSDIERFLEGRSVSAKEDTKWEAILKFAKRNKGFSTATAAATVLLAVVLIWSSVINYQARVRAEDAYSAYLQEQEEKRAQARKSVPAFVEAARLAAQRRKLDDALAQVNAALDYDPDYASAHLLKGQLAIARKDFAAARPELELYLKLRPGDTDAKKLADLAATARADDPAAGAELANVLLKQDLPTLAERLLEAPEKLLEVHRRKIEVAWPGQGAQLGLRSEGKISLSLTDASTILDLSPLQGIPIRSLSLNSLKIRDLTPLKGMPLTSLSLHACSQVTDLSPLKGMPLTTLYHPNGGAVSDLSPLKGMPLTSLSLNLSDPLPNLSPLRDLPLTELTLIGPLRNRDLRFLRDMPLTRLSLSQCSEITELTPLRGKQLTALTLVNCVQLTDISALQGMPLTTLELNKCGPIPDLSVLKDMPLTNLTLSNITQPLDLTPLAGLQLTWLNLYGCTGVSDLTPLKGVPLSYLNLYTCSKVSDLTPLKGMPLTVLSLTGCGQITDLTPLEGMRLTQFDPLIPMPNKGAEVIRRMRTLISMNGLPAEEFWKKYDAGEYNKK